MQCPKCGFEKSKVYQSGKFSGGVYRQRICLGCNRKYWTSEFPLDNAMEARAFMATQKMAYRDRKARERYRRDADET